MRCRASHLALIFNLGHTNAMACTGSARNCPPVQPDNHLRRLTAADHRPGRREPVVCATTGEIPAAAANAAGGSG